MTRAALALTLAAVLTLNAATARAIELAPADRAAINAIVNAEVAAWNRGDAAACAAPVTNDVVFTNIVGAFLIGREPFKAQHARIFTTVYKGSTMTQRIEHVTLVRPDVAVVDTLAGVSGFAALPPGVEAVDGVLQTRLEQVMVRDGSAWRVAAFHNVVVNARALAMSR